MKNSNITPCKQPLNFKNSKKCGAKTRKAKPCLNPAMKNGRCRMHGGKSTGAKTVAGIEKIKKANLKNGFYTKEAIEERELFSQLLKENKRMLKEIY